MQSDATIELSADFLEWVSDPQNTRALEAVENTMDALKDFGATPKILDFRRSALTRLRNAGVRRWMPMQTITRIAATLLVLAVVGGGAGMPEPTGGIIFDGHRRTSRRRVIRRLAHLARLRQ